MTTNKQLKVKLVRSTNGTPKRDRECINGLGLRRMHHEVVLQDNLTVRGLIAKVRYMLNVEEA